MSDEDVFLDEHYRASEAGQLRARIADLEADDKTLRELLAIAYSGPGNLYMDDGCLQDNSTQPLIDYRNMTVAEIGQAIRDRGEQAAEGAKQNAELEEENTELRAQVAELTKTDHERFREFMQATSAEVRNWPKWKQDLLGGLPAEAASDPELDSIWPKTKEEVRKLIEENMPDKPYTPPRDQEQDDE